MNKNKNIINETIVIELNEQKDKNEKLTTELNIFRDLNHKLKGVNQHLRDFNNILICNEEKQKEES